MLEYFTYLWGFRPWFRFWLAAIGFPRIYWRVSNQIILFSAFNYTGATGCNVKFWSSCWKNDQALWPWPIYFVLHIKIRTKFYARPEMSTVKQANANISYLDPKLQLQKTAEICGNMYGIIFAICDEIKKVMSFLSVNVCEYLTNSRYKRMDLCEKKADEVAAGYGRSSPSLALRTTVLLAYYKVLSIIHPHICTLQNQQWVCKRQLLAKWFFNRILNITVHRKSRKGEKMLNSFVS